MKILLTGGSGLVGRTLAPLLREKHEVVHFDSRDPSDGLPFHQGDLRDRDAVEKACEGIDAIFHIAALHGRAWDEAGDDTGFAVNTEGTKNILEAAVHHDVKRVVYTSSIWASGHLPDKPKYLPIDEEMQRQPQELYGLTKILGEQMCSYYTHKYGISTICLRPGGISPADDTPLLKPGLLFGCVDVRDVTQAHVLALEASLDLKHEVFIITPENPLCLVNPQDFFKYGFSVLEKFHQGITDKIPAETGFSESEREWFSIGKAKQILGYRPKYNFIFMGE